MFENLKKTLRVDFKFWFVGLVIVSTRTPVAGAEGSTQTEANVPVN